MQTPTYLEVRNAFEFRQVTKNNVSAGDAIAAFDAWVKKIEDAAYNRGFGAGREGV